MKQPHLGIEKTDISPYVLLPGDPTRVDLIGEALDGFRILASNREFRVGVGTYRNRRITVCSTGIGGPSTAIAVEELIAAGAQYLIRVGTCGGAWRKDIPRGSLIIPSACVRDEGTTLEYIAPGFPACADLDVIQALREAARQSRTTNFCGINRTHDAFYGSEESITKWGRYLLDERWKNLDTPILSSDMETSILYVLSGLCGIKAGCVLAVNADPEPLKDRLQGVSQSVITESSRDMTRQVVEQAIRVALDAMILL